MTCSSKTDLKILKECIEQATDSPFCFDNEHNAPKANQNPKRICPRDGERSDKRIHSQVRVELFGRQ